MPDLSRDPFLCQLTLTFGKQRYWEAEPRVMYVGGGAIINAFYFVSSHGTVIFYIAVHPDCTISEIADSLTLTRRTVWGLIGDLRRASTLHVRKLGRRHYYTVNLDAPFLHPTIRGYTLRTVLGGIMEENRRHQMVAAF